MKHGKKGSIPTADINEIFYISPLKYLCCHAVIIIPVSISVDDRAGMSVEIRPGLLFVIHHEPSFPLLQSMKLYAVFFTGNVSNR